MKIAPISAPATYGYSRLKKVFTSGQNYTDYTKIVSTAKNKIVGNIPNELIQIISKKFPTQKAAKIKELQNTFGNIADTLKLIQEAEIDYAKSIKDIPAIIDYISSNNLKTINSKDSQNLIKYAEQQLAKGLKEILPEGNTSIKYIGQGAFSNAFKMEVANKNGEKLFADRVLKIYKNQRMFIELRQIRSEMLKQILAHFSDEEILKLVRSKNMFADQNDTIILHEIKKIRSNNKQNTPEKWEEIFKYKRKKMSLVHGIYAEANSAMRLKHIVGHKFSKTNVIEYDMFDLERGYSITKFSDKNLPKITSEVDFKTLGLVATDMNPKNVVNKRLIDFGGIKFNDKLIQLTDNNILKFYKQIKNRKNSTEQQALIRYYQELIKNPKTPLRDKIEQAIKLITENQPT